MSQAPAIDKPTRRKSAPAPAAPAAPTKPARGARRASESAPPLGVLASGPRVDLLPPIVEVRRRQNSTLRLLVLGLLGVVLIAVVASFAVALLAGAAEDGLAQERSRSDQLLTEQQQYSELMTVKSQLIDYGTAQVAALYPEADWARIMRELDAALPAGGAIVSESVTVKGIDAKDVSASAPVPGAVTIDTPGVIQISFTATAPVFESPTPLLNSLKNLTGYLSANVSAVAETGEDGYLITGVVQLGSGAFGGTARTAALDATTLANLRDSLLTAITTPPSATTPSEGATDTSTGTGQ